MMKLCGSMQPLLDEYVSLFVVRRTVRTTFVTGFIKRSVFLELARVKL